MTSGWQFWIDRGGTFTDVVAKRPDGELIVRKLLSQSELYADAPIQGIRDLLQLAPDEPIPVEDIDAIKMGTTVATNALLERRGDRVVLAITEGFADALRIGDQTRPELFARQIVRPDPLCERIIEVNARVGASGTELSPLDRDRARRDFQAAYDDGIRSCAICLLHGYRYSEHEQAVAEVAREVGFDRISISHQVMPLIGLVNRAETTVVDAYLSPVLRRYIDRVAAQIDTSSDRSTCKLMFVQSNGGLTDATTFQGKDSILSGPAGGIVGAVRTSAAAGCDKIVTFDMGGTSTDVAHYAGEYERSSDNVIAGVRLQTPMLDIHTVAAGGGSIVQFDGARYRVGPESAGAQPGPVAYGNGGPLAITDCNVMLGKLQPDLFPRAFGASGDRPLDAAIVREKFTELAATIGDGRAPEAVAEGFVKIAVETMASAIEKITLERGYEIAGYTLCCFGGAGGQHACQIADALGIEQILIHPLAGVLSAYGIGLADVRILREQSVEATLTPDLLPTLDAQFANLEASARAELERQGHTQTECDKTLRVKYAGTDAAIAVSYTDLDDIAAQFTAAHRQRYGFVMDENPLAVAAIALELVARSPETPDTRACGPGAKQIATAHFYSGDRWHEAPVYARESLAAGDTISGPAIITEPAGTTIIEPEWSARVTADAQLLLARRQALRSVARAERDLTVPDPVRLEIFNNLFRKIAEQMGTTLQNTSYSVNIKERRDFSCAIFDASGDLAANAPHIPVHLGSMSASVQSLIRDRGRDLQPGDVYALNNPYNGGTHLPDITVVTPVFLAAATRPEFFVASRGHHADIGGITPGSMPPHSAHIDEEGILLDNVPVVTNGVFRDRELRALLADSPYPARNPEQNLTDLKAQIAANEKGIRELQQAIAQFGIDTVRAYMQHVQDNAEASVRNAIDVLRDGSFTCVLDNGARICVAVTIDRHRCAARIDFTGTSPQQQSNFNAPKAICQAVVLYVFRTLVSDNIPLNAGCLRPLDIVIPPGSLLDPSPPAAVVAGNVETSQAIADALYGALGVLAASQGTMNNLTFGNATHQYYETICGGAGAGPTFPGADAVHTHMTNSRLTDPEVLELRFPVRVAAFSIRAHSGGNGRYRGGNGVIRKLHFLEPMTVAILSNRRYIAPHGLAGGETALPGRNAIQTRDRHLHPLEGTATATVEPGDTLIVETPGGGGFGAVTERDERPPASDRDGSER